jgi:D-alanyl-D-alanine carboxypeptidase
VKLCKDVIADALAVAKCAGRVLAAAAVLLGFVFGPVSAQALPAAMIAKIDAAVRADVRSAGTPGVSLAIVRNEKIVYLKGYGYKDLATHAPVDPRTIFRFGSVSKMFTACVLLQLQQEGKLSLEAPVSDWFPWAPRARDVRVVDLLSQVSGYEDYYPLDYVDSEMSRRTTVDAIAREYGSRPLTAPPRTRWEYSNTNYTLAGLIAQKVTGVKFDRLLQKRIFGPFGMTNTFFDEPMRQVSDRATGYNSYFTERQHVGTAEAPDWLNAAGGLAGTSADLARWDIALMKRSVLDDASIQNMTQERVLMPGAVHTGYGLGLTIQTRNGHRLVGHTGAVIGFASANTLAIDDGAAVVVLTNSYEAPASLIARHVLETIIPDLAKRVTRSATPAAPRGKRAHAAELSLISRGLSALRSGAFDTTLFNGEFLAFMDATNVRRARKTLDGLGRTQRIEFLYTGPRGGLEVTSANVRFATGSRTAVVYATPESKIAELFLFP